MTLPSILINEQTKRGDPSHLPRLGSPRWFLIARARATAAPALLRRLGGLAVLCLAVAFRAVVALVFGVYVRVFHLIGRRAGAGRSNNDERQRNEGQMESAFEHRGKKQVREAVRKGSGRFNKPEKLGAGCPRLQSYA